MKVLIIHNRYITRGGEDTVVDNELELLKSVHNVKLYETSSRQLPQNMILSSITAFWNEREIKNIESIVQDWRPDIIHIHNTFPYISPAIYRSSLISSIPIVQTIHNFRLSCINGLHYRDGNVCEDCVGKFGLPGIRHKCYKDSYLASTANAIIYGTHKFIDTFDKIDIFLVLTNFSKDLLIREGIPKEKIYIKPNFTNDIGYSASNGKYVLFVGRLTEEKGIKILLDAWNRRNDDLILKIVGDGELSNLVSDSLSKNIEYVGRLEQSATLETIKNAKYIIVPSLWYEGMPMTIIESFSLGTPVIASNLGGIPEIVRDGYNGYLFTPGDVSDLLNKIDNINSNDELLEQMRMNARLTYEEQYSQEQNLNMLDEAYAIAIAKKG